MQSRTAAQNATATVVRNGAVLLKNIRVEQRAASAPRLFLQLFNTNAPTVGTTAPELVVPVAAGSANKDSARTEFRVQGEHGGVLLGTGCAYAVTTTHDGSTAPTAGQEPTVILDYEHVG